MLKIVLAVSSVIKIFDFSIFFFIICQSPDSNSFKMLDTDTGIKASVRQVRVNVTL